MNDALVSAQVGEVDKIDLKVTNGLAGVYDSLAYRVHEIEKHVHNREYWYAKDGGDNYFSPTSLTSWQVQAGTSGAFGTPLQISNGDEIESGDVDKYYDPHRIFVTAVSATGKLYRVQFLYGTGVVGDATVLTEVPVFVPATVKSGPIEVIADRIACNNKLWVKIPCETDSATLDFIIGIHVYEG